MTVANTQFPTSWHSGPYSSQEGVPMLTRIRHQVVRPRISRPKGMAFAVALFAAFSASSAFAQCRGGSGGSGGGGGSGGTGGAGINGTGGFSGTGLASFGTGNGAFAATGQGQTGQGQTGQGQNGHGLFAISSEQMFQPAFQHIVDDNRQYLAERRAFRAAKVEQARQRLASRKEKPTKHRVVAVNMSRK